MVESLKFDGLSFITNVVVSKGLKLQKCNEGVESLVNGNIWASIHSFH